MSFLKKAKYIFLFKKPHIEELECIDLIIDDKPQILIIWNITRGHKIKITPLQKSYRKKSGTVLLALPKNLQVIEIRISNIWRSISTFIPLTHTQLDDKTAVFLIKSIKRIQRNGEVLWQTPLRSISILENVISVPRIFPNVLQTPKEIIQNKIQISKRIILQTHKLKFP